MGERAAKDPNEQLDSLSLFETDLYDREEIRDETCRLVLMRIGGEWYGIEVGYVKEVLPRPKVTILPNVPNYILGIFSLRGTIISATDLAIAFGIEGDEVREGGRIVVVENEGISTGLVADEATGVVEIPVSRIEPPISTLGEERMAAVEGQLKWDGKLIALLDVCKVIEKTSLKGRDRI